MTYHFGPFKFIPPPLAECFLYSIESIANEQIIYDIHSDALLVEVGGVALNDLGTKIYFTKNDTIGASVQIFEYNLTIPFDVSTAVYNQDITITTDFYDTTQYYAALLSWSKNGEKLYITETTSTFIAGYTLSTAWDISTATLDYLTYPPAWTSSYTPDGLRGILVNNDTGLNGLCVDYSDNKLCSLAFSTPWDFSTGQISSEVDYPIGFRSELRTVFGCDGKAIFSFDPNTGVSIYEIVTAWDISTINTTAKVSITYDSVPDDFGYSILSIYLSGSYLYAFGGDARYAPKYYHVDRYALGDSTPDQFIFTDQTGVATSTVIESNTITITGIDIPAKISIVGGEYSINAGAYTSANGQVIVDDVVKVQHISSVTAATTTNTVLTIDTIDDTFSTTTA